MESAPWPKELQLPPLRDFEPHPPLSDEGRRALATFVEAANDWLERLQESNLTRAEGLQALNPRDLAYLADALETLQYNQGEFWTPFEWAHVPRNLHKLLADTSPFEPIQLVRILILTGDLGGRAGISWAAQSILSDYRKLRGMGFGLRDLGRLFEIAGLNPDLIAQVYLDSWRHDWFRWGPDATWPFFAERTDALQTALRGNFQQSSTHREPHCSVNAFDALDCFPRVPPPLEEELW
jgi:hypothetical protein